MFFGENGKSMTTITVKGSDEDKYLMILEAILNWEIMREKIKTESELCLEEDDD